MKTLRNYKSSGAFLFIMLLIGCQGKVDKLPVAMNKAVITLEHGKNGLISAKGAVIAGNKEGLWIDYDWLVKDRIGNESVYQGGKLNGQSIDYFANGDTLNAGYYINDLREGVWRQFQGGHSLQSIGRYSKDEKVGTWDYFSPNGILMRRISYKDGKETILIDREPPLPPH